MSPLSATEKIDQERKEQKDVERHMRDLDSDLRKLSVLLSQNRSCAEDLQQGNLVTGNELVRALKVRALRPTGAGGQREGTGVGTRAPQRLPHSRPRPSPCTGL